jgi:hypothetical protein
LDPPYGYQPANLGRLNWEWCCEGLVVFKLSPPAFELHFDKAVLPRKLATLIPGQTLLTALRSCPAKSIAIDLPTAIADIASRQGLFTESKESLESYLGSIVVPTPEAPTTTSSIASHSKPSTLEAVRRLSVWTPGNSESEFLSFYTPIIGDAAARHLWAINRNSISAVSQGNFQRQIGVSDELHSLVPDNVILAGEASYFKAEGLRLLADVERTPEKKGILRDQATDEYLHAETLLKDDPRPIRGLGRLLEIKGDFNGALKQFTIAKGLCLTQRSRDSLTSNLDLAHEILRSTRHFIHCLLDIRSTNLSSAWHRVNKEHEIEGYLSECENLHFENMPQFLSEPAWYYIEWFMGLVFLAKAWGGLGHFTHMQRTLVKALDARRRLLVPASDLSPVERANLEWWLSVARMYHNVGFEPDFSKMLDRVEAALRANDLSALRSSIDEIVALFLPQWASEARR